MYRLVSRHNEQQFVFKSLVTLSSLESLVLSCIINLYLRSRTGFIIKDYHIFLWKSNILQCYLACITWWKCPVSWGMNHIIGSPMQVSSVIFHDWLSMESRRKAIRAAYHITRLSFSLSASLISLVSVVIRDTSWPEIRITYKWLQCITCSWNVYILAVTHKFCQNKSIMNIKPLFYS